MLSFRAFPALNTGTLCAGLSTTSLVCGLRPVLAARCFTSKTPKPVSLIFSSLFRPSVIVDSRLSRAMPQSFLPSRSYLPYVQSILACSYFLLFWQRVYSFANNILCIQHSKKLDKSALYSRIPRVSINLARIKALSAPTFDFPALVL